MPRVWREPHTLIHHYPTSSSKLPAFQERDGSKVTVWQTEEHPEWCWCGMCYLFGCGSSIDPTFDLCTCLVGWSCSSYGAINLGTFNEDESWSLCYLGGRSSAIASNHQQYPSGCGRLWNFTLWTNGRSRCSSIPSQRPVSDASLHLRFPIFYAAQSNIQNSQQFHSVWCWYARICLDMPIMI